MPMQIEHEGQTITVYTQDELDQEVKGLKVTNGNLKAEKTEAEDKLKELKASVQDFEVQLAEAQGDKDKAERLMQEIKDAKEAEHKELLNTIKNKEVQAVINGLVTKHGAGGTKNEDLHPETTSHTVRPRRTSVRNHARKCSERVSSSLS
ncbi:MAG TPA: hypothetical protein VL020_06615, partial [Pseudomonadales bacterium]|nr:hypothetical protein [Pseudomonadales bacterium]